MPSETSPRILRCSSWRAARQRGADRREGILAARRDVGRAADHVEPSSPVPSSTSADAEAVGVRMRPTASTSRRPRMSLEVRVQRLDRVDRRAQHGARRSRDVAGVEHAPAQEPEPADGRRSSAPADAELARGTACRPRQQPDVGNAVAQHRDAVRAPCRRPSRCTAPDRAAVLEHRRMHHAAAQDLHPARALAGGAAAARGRAGTRRPSRPTAR